MLTSPEIHGSNTSGEIAKTADVLILGAGLAGALAAYRIRKAFPELQVALFEQRESLEAVLASGPTWSFHETDVTPSQNAWLSPLLAGSWSSQDVVFPGFKRTLDCGYRSLRAETLYPRLLSMVPAIALHWGVRVVRLESDSIWTETGPEKIPRKFQEKDPEQVQEQVQVQVQEKGQERGAKKEKWTARWIIDARGARSVSGEPAPKGGGNSCGYQKFVGLDLKLKAPHGLTRPVIMDASEQVAQLDGFRFFYVLPWDSHRLLIEDTRYSSNAVLESEVFEQEVLRYAEAQGWLIEGIERREKGVLPIPLFSEKTPVLAEASRGRQGLMALGMRSGSFHPTTGYSLPWTVRQIDQWVSERSLERDLLGEKPKREQGQSLPLELPLRPRKWGFYTFLNRMLFLGTLGVEAQESRVVNEARRAIMAIFYRKQSEKLISRFYSGTLTLRDCVRVLAIRPPIPVMRALQCARPYSAANLTKGIAWGEQ